VILEPPRKSQPSTDGTTRAARSRPAVWRRRRVQVIGLGVLLLGAVLVLTRSQSAPPAPATPQPAAPLIAHGQILPAHQARVGTQGGGVVQHLNASPGDQIAGQAPLAAVVGPSGTEVVTAPFAGTITNVLVHAGDTLLPGATIAVVADMRVLQVETSDVDEFLVSKVATGQRVQVNVDALDNLVLTGTVTNVALLPQSGTSGSSAYPVILSVSALPPEVRAGMSVRVTFPEGH
jgi:biotin carboxyl carrier protein